MELQINNQQFHFDQTDINIQMMLDHYWPNKQKGIAVAVNSTVISNRDWATYRLSEQDTILIITATQGG